MTPLDNLTVCITSFRRTEFLDRALTSVRKAGIRRVAIAAIEAPPELSLVIDQHNHGWLSFDVEYVGNDIGCNNTWMLAAYISRTERIILLHDDDLLNPEFGEAYEKIIAPVLDNPGYGVGFASWRAHVLNEDGSIRPTEYWSGKTRILQSRELAGYVARFNTLSLSPVISVFNRKTLIHACKEAEATLTHNECLERPGMLLGTEIIVYLRHCKACTHWLYVDKVLSMYGSHEGSGTVRAERSGDLRQLTRGYDRARTQAAMNRAPEPAPKIILAYQYIDDPLADARAWLARISWAFHLGTFDMINCQVSPMRTSAELGDERPTPFVRDIFDAGCSRAMPEDIILFTNTDVGLTTCAPERVLAGVRRGNGATACPRRVLDNPNGERLYKTVRNCKVDGGVDAFAMTPAWWKNFRENLPDMLIGREAWDLCLRVLIEEWADGGAPHNFISTQPADWWRSHAYTDDVIWHEPHESYWKTARRTNKGGAYNRMLARGFFESRKNLVGLACVAEPDSQPAATTISLGKADLAAAGAAGE